MFKKIARIFLVIIVSSMFLTGIMPVTAADEDINIVHTSDMQGTLFKNVEAGTIGYGNILSVNEKLGDPIVIDCGNFLGDPSLKELGLNEKIVSAMNKAGYDFATLGYNDLKYKKEDLDSIFSGAQFEILSSNIMIGEEYAFKKSITKVEKGVKVGIFAVTDCESTDEFTVLDPLKEAKKVVNELKAGGSKVIICVLNTKNENLAERLIGENSSLTMVLESGTNRFRPQGEPIGRTLVVNPGSKGNAIGVSAVTVDSGVLKSFRTSNYNLGNIEAIFPETNMLEQEMKGAQDVIDDYISVILATFPEELSFDETEISIKTTPLGNFITDAIRGAANADIAIIRGSQIKAGLPKEVKGKDINNLFRENDDIVVAEVYGKDIFKCMEISVEDLVLNDDGEIDPEESKKTNFLQISGLKVEYNMEYSEGERVVSIVTDSGEKISGFSNKKFKVAGPSKILNFADATELKTVGNMTEKIINYLSSDKDLSLDKESRCIMTDKGKDYTTVLIAFIGGIILLFVIIYGIAQIVVFIIKKRREKKSKGKSSKSSHSHSHSHSHKHH